MANALTPRTPEEKAKIASGLSGLVQKTPLAADPSSAGNDALAKQFATMIDRNFKAPAETSGTSLFADNQPAAPAIGAKDLLKNLITTERSDARLTNAADINTLEAAMAQAGHETDLDGTISDAERNQLGGFLNDLNSGRKFSQIFAVNADKAAEMAAAAEAKRIAEEAAKQTKEDIAAQVKAGLDYAGLKTGETPESAAAAMNQFIVTNEPSANWKKVQTEIFPDAEQGDWTPSAHGVAYMRQKMAGKTPRGLTDPSADAVKEDLSEGGNTARAQAYLKLMGYNDVAITGTIDRATIDAAQTEITKPMQAPQLRQSGDGTYDTTDLNRVYADAKNGQIHFPLSELSEEERAAYDALPTYANREVGGFLCKEYFIANIIIDEPERYQQILDKENALRADAKIEATLDTTGMEYRQEAEVALNPASTVVTNTPVIEAGLDEGAIAVTSSNGLAVFENAEQGLENLVAALKEKGPMTLSQTVGFVQYANLELGDNKPFSMVEPAPHNVDAVAETLGRSGHDVLDPNDPAALRDMVVGTIAYRDTMGEGVPFLSSEIESRLPTNDPQTADLINRVTGMDGVAPQQTPAPAPAEPVPAQEGPGWMSRMLSRIFVDSAEARELAEETPANKPPKPTEQRPIEAPNFSNAMGF